MTLRELDTRSGVLVILTSGGSLMKVKNNRELDQLLESIITREVILTSAEQILTTFYFLSSDPSHTDCFMPDPLVRQSSVDFTVTDQHII